MAVHEYFRILIFIYYITIFVSAAPTELSYCSKPVNESDCGFPKRQVFYYKPGSRCKTTYWKGCLTDNIFPDENTCILFCIGKVYSNDGNDSRTNTEKNGRQVGQQKGWAQKHYYASRMLPRGEQELEDNIVPDEDLNLPKNCLKEINDNKCKEKGIAVYTYDRGAQNCVEKLWYGCPSENMFKNVYECNKECRQSEKKFAKLKLIKKLHTLPKYLLENIDYALEDVLNNKTDKLDQDDDKSQNYDNDIKNKRRPKDDNSIKDHKDSNDNNAKNYKGAKDENSDKDDRPQKYDKDKTDNKRLKDEKNTKDQNAMKFHTDENNTGPKSDNGAKDDIDLNNENGQKGDTDLRDYSVKKYDKDLNNDKNTEYDKVPGDGNGKKDDKDENDKTNNKSLKDNGKKGSKDKNAKKVEGELNNDNGKADAKTLVDNGINDAKDMKNGKSPENDHGKNKDKNPLVEKSKKNYKNPNYNNSPKDHKAIDESSKKNYEGPEVDENETKKNNKGTEDFSGRNKDTKVPLKLNHELKVNKETYATEVSIKSHDIDRPPWVHNREKNADTENNKGTEDDNGRNEAIKVVTEPKNYKEVTVVTAVESSTKATKNNKITKQDSGRNDTNITKPKNDKKVTVETTLEPKKSRGYATEVSILSGDNYRPPWMKGGKFNKKKKHSD